jgi:hypothetical protein
MAGLVLLLINFPLPAFAGTATHLAFDAPLPSNHLNGFQLNSVKVDVEDSSNAIVTTSSASITLTLTGPAGYTNTTTHNASSGTWTFNYSGLALSTPGMYTMIASSGTLTNANQNLGITAAMIPPQNTMLAGMFANDSENGLNYTTIDQFETAIGRTFYLDMYYFAFTDSKLQSSSAFETAIGTDVTNHRIPVVSWKCPAAGAGTISQIANSTTWDTTIAGVATTLAAHQGPVLLRWFWEMNLVSSGDETWKCLSYPSSGNPNTATVNQAHTDFINAWNKIQSIFQTNHASNVIWLWNPGAGNDKAPDGTENGTYTDDFYPSTNSVNGWSAVDWIGIDAYNRQNDDFEKTFLNGAAGDASYGYSEQLAHGKPLIIGENGALETSETHQISYFDQGVSYLQAYTPAYAAYMYFASHATFDWDFTTSGSPNGLTEYSSMVTDPYLSAVNPNSQLSYSTYGNFNDHVYVAMTSTSVTHGVATTINFELGSTTLSTHAPTGTVSIYSGGNNLTPTAVTVSCTVGNYCKGSASVTFGTVGTHPLVAVYSGDTNYDGGQSWPIYVTVN